MSSPPVWQSVAVTAAASATPAVACAYPSGVVAGDLLVAVVSGEQTLANNGPHIIVPSGWESGTPDAGLDPGTTERVFQRALFRVADGTETGSQTFSFTQSAAQATVEIHRITGCDVSPSVNLTVSPWSGFDSAAYFSGGAGVYPTGIGFGAGVGHAANAAFCLEFRYRRDRTGAVEIIAGWTDVFGSNEITVRHEAGSNRLQLFWYDSTPTYVNAFTTGTVASGATAVVRICYDGTTLRLYLNGVKDIEVVTSMKAIDTAELWLGRHINAVNGFKGVIDELRVSNVARSTGASYVVDTAPFGTDGNTLLLAHLDSMTGAGVFTDSSGNGHTGQATHDPFNIVAQSTWPSTSGVDPVGPSVTTTVNNCLIFQCLAHYHSTTTGSHTPTAGFVERTDFESTVSSTILSSTTATLAQTTAGATGSYGRDCTLLIGTDAMMTAFALSPPSALVLGTALLAATALPETASPGSVTLTPSSAALTTSAVQTGDPAPGPVTDTLSTAALAGTAYPLTLTAGAQANMLRAAAAILAGGITTAAGPVTVTMTTATIAALATSLVINRTTNYRRALYLDHADGTVKEIHEGDQVLGTILPASTAVPTRVAEDVVYVVAEDTQMLTGLPIRVEGSVLILGAAVML